MIYTCRRFLIGRPVSAALAILAPDRRSGDAECPLLVTRRIHPGVVERRSEDVLSVLRQMVRNRRWKLIVGRIGYGEHKMATTTDDTRHTQVSRARMSKWPPVIPRDRSSVDHTSSDG